MSSRTRQVPTPQPKAIDFGVVLQADPPASRTVELVRLAEQHRFTHAWTFDSHMLWQEPFVVMGRILAETDRITVGTMVTNPGTRDWTVLASLFATLNDMYGNRTICGMGRGDSALRYMGRRPCSLAEMVDSMAVIKNLVAGRQVPYNDVSLRIPWISEGWDLPMWAAGYGPKALAAIGQSADGFILQLADPQILEWTVNSVRQAASACGRNPADIKICVVAPAYVGDDLAHQIDQLRWFGGMVGNHVHDLVMRYGSDDPTTVPKALADYITARQGYDYSHHGRAGNPSTDFVPDSIVERFCILGPVDRHVSRLQELRGLGMDHFGIYLMHDRKETTLKAYGEEIIPALSSS